MINEKDLPDGWKNVELSEILTTLENGNRPKGGIKDIKEGIASLGGEHLNSNGSFNFNNIRLIPKSYYDSLRRGKIKNGDVLIVKDGATTGKTSFVSNDFPYHEASVNEHVFILRGKKELINPKFLFYHLFSPNGQRQIMANFHGAAIGGINTQFVKNYNLILPPLPTQKKIVAILDKAEKLKGWRREADELTNELLKSTFLEMFGDPVKNPKGWEIKKIGEFTEVKTGGTPSRKKSEYWKNGTIPWIKTTEIKENIISEIDEYITESGFNNSNVTIVPKNSILIAMYGQGKTRGKTAKTGIPSTTNQACAAILPSNEYVSDFLWYLLKLSYHNLRNLGRGGNQPNLNLSMVKNYKVIIPDLETQYKFAKVARQTEKLHDYQNKSNEYINTLFNALMQQAFRGELT